MGYTPTILFNWDDVKPEHHVEVQARRDDDSASNRLAEELLYFLTYPNDLKEFGGMRVAYLSPAVSSHAYEWEEWLTDRKIKFVSIGG